MLVLRNGQIVEGQITRAGDYYVVLLGKTGEIRLPQADVDFQCSSREEAYAVLSARLPATAAAGHLDLADWCLQQGMLSHAASELVTVMRIEPDHPRLKQLETYLEIAAKAPAVKPAAPLTGAARVTSEQLEKTAREMPSGSVEKFTAIVQPLLLNRCGANQCHGPNGKSDFTLLRPAAGQFASQRFTQRNLYSVLQQIDQSNPEASPLLMVPQRRHGTALSAVFDKHSQKQLEEITAWVKMAISAPAVQGPSTIPAAQTAMLSQPGDTPAAANPPLPFPPATAETAGPVRTLRPEFDPPVKPRAGAAPVIRDPFDPELFNRKYHPH
jgi:hypothetical protein